MALRVLSQTALASGTDTDILTGVQVASTVVTGLIVCNRANVAAAFRLWIRLKNVTTTNAQYILYDYQINPSDAPVFTFGISGLGFQPGDVLSARADTANLSVTVMGEG